MLKLNCAGEDVDQLILKGIKLLTLRRMNAEKYPFQVGDLVIAYCPDAEIKEIPVIVFHRKVTTLPDFDTLELLVDGFHDAEEALDGLGRYYSGLTMDDAIIGLGFITEERFRGLSLEAQNVLLGEPFEQAVRNPMLHEIFLPSLLQWLIWTDDVYSVEDWHDFLINYDFFSVDELKAVKEASVASVAYYRLLNRSDRMQNVLNNPLKPVYQSVVLVRKITDFR